jgi:hypothetical protein
LAQLYQIRYTFGTVCVEYLIAGLMIGFVFESEMISGGLQAS